MAPLEMPLKDAAIVLAKLGFKPWLKSHGKIVRSDLSRKQAIELRECFEMLDDEGTGTIYTRDVPMAFTVLGMDVTKTEVEEAIYKFMARKRIMQYYEFMRLMMSKSDKLPNDEYSPSSEGKPPKTDYSLPLVLLGQAYRRKKLIEGVMGGDKKMEDRMNYRSKKSMLERKALRDILSGKVKEEPTTQAVEAKEKENERAKAAALKRRPRHQHSPEPAVPSYLIANVAPDVSELLLGPKRNEVIKTVLDSDVKVVPPTNKSIEFDRPFSGPGGQKLSPAYLREKLEAFREDMQHKPTMRKQVIRVQALKTVRDFHENGSFQVKGSPLLYPASRRPTVA